MARAKEQKNGRLEEALAKVALSHASLEQNHANLEQAHASMAKSHAQLEESVALLNQTQAIFNQTQANNLAQFAAYERESAEWWRRADERFTRIEAILIEHGRILERLPDAVREKIGFK